MITKRLILVVPLALVLALVGPARADLLQFDLVWEFSGGTPPSGDPDPVPWLRATFESSEPGLVYLTLDNYLQGASEYVSAWLFNLDPSLDPKDLNIGLLSGPNATVSQGTNLFKADGDGCFDIQFEWPTDYYDPNRFDDSYSKAEFEITSDEAITAGSFAFFSLGAGNSVVGLYTAAHVQGIGPDGEESGWITVPAPGAVLLGAVGLGGIVWLRRRLP